MKDKEYELLTKRQDMHWFCQGCESKAMLSIKVDKEISQRCGEYFAVLETRFVDIERSLKEKADIKRVKDIEERLRAAEKSLKDISKGREKSLNEDKLHQHVQDQVKEVAAEQHEIDRRRSNIIVHNIPESSASDSADRIRHDAKMMAELCHTQFNLSVMASEMRPIRLGRKRENGKPRLLKVEMPRMELRKELLRRAKELRKSDHDIFKYVYICPDLTPKQREAGMKLVQELEKRKEDGEADLIIRRGKIVKKSGTHEAMDETSTDAADHSSN